MDAKLDPTLASRYLANQLSDRERQEYEALLVSDPQAVAELEATARLKVGLAKLSDRGELDHLLQHRPSRTFLLPMAAALAAIGIGAALWWLTRVHTGAAPLLFTSHASLVKNASHPFSTTIRAALYIKRADVPAERIEKPDAPAEIVLRVLPSPLNKSHRYRLSLSRIRASVLETVARVDDLVPTPEDGFLECYLDGARLAPGRYEVIVTDQSTAPGTSAATVMFDLLAK
ncbi:MAG TPA: hypothetical protein VI653_18670 [Steroidobacteraceae bacterium]